jgi:hypothetical protein
MKMWLDDMRDPILYTLEMDWNWVKTAQEAIDLLRTGTITRASLDHDLTDEQMVKGGFPGQVYENGHKSGYDVVCWLEQHPEFWPINGVKVHSANPSGAARMRQVINRHYRR